MRIIGNVLSQNEKAVKENPQLTKITLIVKDIDDDSHKTAYFWQTENDEKLPDLTGSKVRLIVVGKPRKYREEFEYLVRMKGE